MSTALRSLDLSRQVGAAVFSGSGEVITLGCNEVPKAGGGTYWADDGNDARDYILGRDENERIKRALLADLVRRLCEGNFIKMEGNEDALVDYVIKESVKKHGIIREALLMDLLEFGRTIHAEMSAISDAARHGRSLRDATLYCTTFPCHICAKHIIASGIKKVVFIEPYPKSYAEHLHKEICITADTPPPNRVQFAPFIGVSPVRFRNLFERGRRKDAEGNFSEWVGGKPRPLVSYTVATYLSNEEATVKLFNRIIRKLTQGGAASLDSSHLRQ